MTHSPLFVAAAAFAAAGAPDLSTDYSRERGLRVQTETVLEMETTSFSMERDGEPVDMGGRTGGSSSVERQRSVEIDATLKHDAGRPTRVRRVFETLEGESAFHFGDQTREGESDCPLSGVTIEVAIDEDGEATVEVVDGDEPDASLLEGHRPELALEELLPEGAVEVGDAWELEKKAIVRALGLDVRSSLFPPPEREDDADEGDGRRRRFGSGRGFGGSSLLAGAEWEGEARLAALDEEHDGQPCALIEVELKAAGDLPEPEGGGFPRRDRMPAAEPLAPRASQYDIAIEGRLYVSLQERRPLAARFEGTVTVEQRMESSRGESTMVMTSTREGTYERTVSVQSVALDSNEEAEK